VVVVLDGAVDLSATAVDDAVDMSTLSARSMVVDDIDKGGAHVHGAVKDHDDVDVSSLMDGRGRLASRQRLGHVGHHVGDERHARDGAGQVAR
jgi:hypothetical protein